MGLYNRVVGSLTCPRCGAMVEAEVETHLGYMHDVLTLRVGDRYPWNHPAMPSECPAAGSAVGDGYAVCPACGRDFFVRVVVEDDVVRRLEPDRGRPGMIPDGEAFQLPPE
jgi:uncharacterized protein (UPF0212 family)